MHGARVNPNPKVDKMKNTVEVTEVAEAKAIVQNLQSWLNEAVHERSSAINGLLLGLMGNQPVCLVGPPGTGKSMLISMLAEAMGYPNTFKYLITKYTDQSELFGQFKLSALKKDKLERRTDNTMVDADFVFLDEVFKANSALLNALLTALNERQADTGTGRVDMPYKLICGASNEVPEEEGLEALWDRWVVRVFIDDRLSDRSWERMLFDTPPTWEAWSNACGIKNAEHLQAAFETLRNIDVTWSNGGRSAFTDARGHVAEAGHMLSPRKWKQLHGLTESAARLRGSDEVERMDVAAAIEYVWPMPENRHTYTEMAAAILAGHLAESQMIMQQFIDQSKEEGLASMAKHLNMLQDFYADIEKELWGDLFCQMFGNTAAQIISATEAVEYADAKYTGALHTGVMNAASGMREAAKVWERLLLTGDEMVLAQQDKVEKELSLCRRAYNRFQSVLINKGSF